MLLLNSVVCGIEICACSGFTYIPPLLLKSGFSEENMSLVLGMGPFLALFIAPVVGRASDRCHSSFGRRRPFILVLSSFLIISLYLIPFGESIITFFIGKGDLSKMLGVLLLTVGSVLLDFTSQTCLTPCEALLNDASKKTGQQERIFSIYSLMVSLGGIIGYLISAINWKSNSVGQFFGGEEASVFSILIFIFTIICVQQFFNVPFVLRQLAYANFCSWTAVMGFNLYFTDFVGQVVYHGNPNAPVDSESGNLYDDGVRMGSWGLLLHCITSAIYSFFVEKLVEKYGSKMTYMMGMTSFSFAMTGMVLVPNVFVVILMAAMTGFAFATLTTIPFILVSKYHEDKENINGIFLKAMYLYFFDVITTTSLSNNGIGTYIATLDSAYFLSQVLLTMCAGYIVRITGTITAYMITAGFMGVFSIVFINRIIISKQDLIILCNERKVEGII
ncbi:hypothetical protein LOTGIDRAFT_163134 [Lottia gigantea]|uniref:Major facilitator superfamily (MFS) profile domain-containing protein n=1 Tax=Lottia gigantea TaxID=225164 RepID=V4A9M2_LOTGI|nr:hypothetical protein LOTGIDRAFT_163134 [Lottia gigantea]ESO91775.1 hypothetical protein LOTGIDRAFT_163134 [Lottia gigantea]